jgi:epoxyqueuosine reductase
LARHISGEPGIHANHRAYVDTGPILERGYAAAAGLGFVGKNTNLIHPKLGSYLLLGEILIDIALTPSPSPSRGGCGTCRRCLDACPTGALIAPHILDARRCISYLTIELKGSIPHDLRPLMGNWIYGCDVCQEVCPWQRFARTTPERSFLAVDTDRAAPRLTDLACMDQRSFAEYYDGSPISRAGRSRLLRNVAVALGNWRQPQALPPLEHLLGDSEPLVRSHAAWALGRIDDHLGWEALQKAARLESDPGVEAEIRRALRTGPAAP